MKSFQEMDKYLEDQDIESVKRPERIDFCWFIKAGSKRFDTVSFKETNIDLNTCSATKIPHLENSFHIYPNGNGVFKGDMLVFESISKENRNDALGILIYNQSAYEDSLKKWKEYWNWMADRNPARWEIQEKGLDYDAKNLLHLIRLLYSAKNIIDNGEPIIRFSGETLAFLRKIREGVFTYEELMDVANPLMQYIDDKERVKVLPETVDMKKANEIFKQLAQ